MKRVLPMNARDVMTKAVTVVGPEMGLQMAHALMIRMTARHLPVVAANGKVIGIVSDRDVLLHAIRSGDGFVYPAVTVAEVMTPSPITAGLSTPISVIASLMLEHKIDAIPVIDRDELIGLVTSSDLVSIVARSVA